MCLKALEKQTLPSKDFEVIVVDDGSGDETPELLGKIQKRGALDLHFFVQKNAGQGVARNKGLANAKGENVLFLGDDIIATPQLLEAHEKRHSDHPEENAGVLGFVAWHPNLKLTPVMRWMVNGSSIFGKFGGHQFAYEKLERGEKPDFNFFYTCNISLKRSFLGKNPFDEAFGKYGWEDIELGYRLQKEKNMRLFYEPKAVGYHYHPMDEENLKKRMEMVGRSAHLIDERYPELKKVPGFWKKMAFYTLSNPLTMFFIKGVKKIAGHRGEALYYYALSKKYFLQGIRGGYNESKKQ